MSTSKRRSRKEPEVREHPAESHDLELHTALCAERYLALETRMDGIDQRLTKIEANVAEIAQDVRKLSENITSRWDSVQIAVIGVLMGIIGSGIAMIFV